MGSGAPGGGAGRLVRENMSEEERGIFDILTHPAPELSADERAAVKLTIRKPNMNRVLNGISRSDSLPQGSP